MLFDTGSVSKRKSELFHTSVLIKMKENQGKVPVHEFIWEYINLSSHKHHYLTPQESLVEDIQDR